MRKLKLVLALTQDAAAKYAAMLRDYSKFFSDKQGAFSGIKNTYDQVDSLIDDPTKRAYSRVVTTVPEKLEYFITHTQDFIQNILTKERTNGLGLATAKLVVAGEEWGTFTSNELLALKSILEKSELLQMIGNIPVRTETDIWTPSTAEEYQGRAIFQKPLITQVIKTTVKEQYILEDKNIDKLKPGADYKPQIGSKDTVLELGTQTRQEFTGAWTHTQRARALENITILRKAVTTALEEANDVEVEESILTSKKLFGFIFQ